MITKMSASSMNAKTWYRSMLAGNEAFSPGAYELISTTTLASTAATVTFSSIPSTYKHLQIRFLAKNSSSTTMTSMLVTYNGNGTANYAWHFMRGNGTNVASSAGASASNISLNNAINGSASVTFTPGIIDILDYASTTNNKTLRALFGNSDAYNNINLSSGFLANTSAISSLTFANSAGGASLAIGTRFSLYGIKG